MPYSSGSQTKNTFLVGPEMGKLHLEFIASGTIHVGQPVKLHADGNKVVPASANESPANIIGVSIHEGESAYGDFVTVAVRGYSVIEALFDEVTDSVPGPVAYTGFDTSTAYTGSQKTFGGHTKVKACVPVAVTVGQSTVNMIVDQFGWCLDKVAAGTPVRVLVKN